MAKYKRWNDIEHTRAENDFIMVAWQQVKEWLNDFQSGNRWELSLHQQEGKPEAPKVFHLILHSLDDDVNICVSFSVICRDESGQVLILRDTWQVSLCLALTFFHNYITKWRLGAWDVQGSPLEVGQPNPGPSKPWDPTPGV